MQLGRDTKKSIKWLRKIIYVIASEIKCNEESPNTLRLLHSASWPSQWRIYYIQRGDYESAAGKYNTGDFNGRNEYTHKVANDTFLWLTVFS